MFNPQILDNEIKIAQPKKRLQLWLGLLWSVIKKNVSILQFKKRQRMKKKNQRYLNAFFESNFNSEKKRLCTSISQKLFDYVMMFLAQQIDSF